MALLSKLFGDDNSRFLKRAFKVVSQINALELEYQKLSNVELKAKTQEFKILVAPRSPVVTGVPDQNLETSGQTLDTILPQAFAAVREAAVRTLGQRHFDVQMAGAIALHEGKIAEMRTGEGKTLTATAAVYLNALQGQGVHIVTVNDYLARRDTVWMGQIYYALGLSVGCINHDTAYVYDPGYSQPDRRADEVRDTLGSFKVAQEFLRPCTRREAYQTDITYGTNNEFGFDYLRDNLVYELNQKVQRDWHFAIVDEVDSILIDEARTPLIISQPDEESGTLYQKFARLVPKLQPQTHYQVDEKLRAATLTQEGISKMESLLGIKNIYEEGGFRMVHHLEQALKAQALFKRDKHYVVKDGEVIIVDEFTGRLMPGRRYSEGLHQAIEAKEGVEVKRESRTVATITFQNYFRLYKKLAGMTGTALTSAEEFYKVYKLEVIAVPTHKPMIRQDLADMVYRSERGKFQAVLRKVKELNERGQPILLGTSSIEKNEHLSALLDQIGIKHEMLNAKNHEREAQVIAQAGRPGAVTLATNIAGRGVDIILGGNPLSPEEAQGVRQTGGLFVLGTERHEARRIDNQLRGRAGRQGDSGYSQFFVSLEDDLMRIFGGEKIKNMMQRFNIPEDEAIKSDLVSKAIESAQAKIEGYHFDARKHVLEYDEVMNKHREVIYKMRRELISPDFPVSSQETVLEMLRGEVNNLIAAHGSIEGGEFNIGEITKGLAVIMPAADEVWGNLSGEAKKIAANPERLTNLFVSFIEKAYEAREQQLGAENMRQLEKLVMLRIIDELWMDHLEEMEYLRDSVGLRAYGQRDPLVEYKTEGHRLFQDLLAEIQHQVASLIFKVGIVAPPKPAQFIVPSKETQDLSVAAAKSGIKVGRNDPCWCGSGKKYKRCHGS